MSKHTLENLDFSKLHTDDHILQLSRWQKCIQLINIIAK